MVTLPPYVSLVRADNPGPMTLDGTNSWVLRGDRGVVVVDPGPSLPAHLDRLASFGRVVMVLLTHGHPDHGQAAAELAGRFDAPVVGLDPLLCRHSEPLRDLDRLEVDGLPPLTVVATPGHSGDSVCFEIEGPRPALMSGDTLLGRGSTMVGHPDGGLADYLTSLHRLAERAAPDSVLLPGHGEPGAGVLEAVDRALAHRLDRLDQVRRALGAGAQTVAEVVALVYPEVTDGLRGAVDSTVRAQLAYLADADRRDRPTPPG